MSGLINCEYGLVYKCMGPVGVVSISRVVLIMGMVCSVVVRMGK